MKKVILASASPRRKELLSEACSEFKILTAPTDETLPEGVHPREGVAILAERKGEAVWRAYDEVHDAYIISSDTLVEADGVPLGKPKDAEDARRMLRMLSGRAHNVHTGIALRLGDRVVSGVATTAVIFRELGDSEIDEYIASGDPMDKAGSYGIQSGGGKFVSGFLGDYDTVVGFSMNLLARLAEEIGAFDILDKRGDEKNG